MPLIPPIRRGRKSFRPRAAVEAAILVVMSSRCSASLLALVLIACGSRDKSETPPDVGGAGAGSGATTDAGAGGGAGSADNSGAGSGPETPVGDVPVGDVPDDDVPGDDVPSAEMSDDDAPGDDVPGAEVSDDDVPDDDVPDDVQDDDSGAGVPADGGTIDTDREPVDFSDSLCTLSDSCEAPCPPGFDVFPELDPTRCFAWCDSIQYSTGEVPDGDCEVVRGDVTVGGSNFEGLERLRMVQGDVALYGAGEDGLLGMKGLEGVVIIGGALKLVAGGMENLDGLTSLQQLGGLDLSLAESLEDLRGLSGVSIQGDVMLSGIDVLGSLDGLQGFTEGSLSVQGAPLLTDLTGLEGFTQGSVYFGLIGADSLELPALVSSPSIRVRAHDGVNLPVLEEVGELILTFPIPGLFNAPLLRHADEIALGDISAGSVAAVLGEFNFPQLESIGHLLIGNTTNANPVASFPALRELGGLQLQGVRELSDLAALQAVSLSGGSLDLRGNPDLQTLSGLEGVTDVTLLAIVKNGTLRDLDGLQTLNHAEGVEVIGNDALQNVDGLSGLRIVDTELEISENPELVSVDGLDALQSVAKINIRSNESLMDCSHLIAVTTDSAWAAANAEAGTCLAQ
jgi:hypothetical protein